jgi:IclR family transcriptional regulator, acetate operon repressor
MSDTPRPRGRPRNFNDRPDQTTVQALDRALLLLDQLALAPGLTLTELSQRAAEAPATVYRALMTLQARGMVELEDTGQLWHIGPGAFRIGSAFLRRTKVVERARAVMDDLMRASGETANLGIESADQVLFLAQVETHEAIRAFFPPGTKSPMHVSGIGKALLAWYPSAKVAGIVKRQGLPGFTAQSILTLETLVHAVARTRARGFAVDDEERTPGMRCLAAPIFNAYGEPVAGLSLSGPAFRMSLDAAPRLGAMVRAAADSVTLATGGVIPAQTAKDTSIS